MMTDQFYIYHQGIDRDIVFETQNVTSTIAISTSAPLHFKFYQTQIAYTSFPSTE